MSWSSCGPAQISLPPLPPMPCTQCSIALPPRHSPSASKQFTLQLPIRTIEWGCSKLVDNMKSHFSNSYVMNNTGGFTYTLLFKIVLCCSCNWPHGWWVNALPINNCGLLCIKGMMSINYCFITLYVLVIVSYEEINANYFKRIGNK
jgi:hypothetical protein